MSREMKRKGRSRKGADDDRRIEVELVPTVEFLHRHVSESLCAEVFEDTRTAERCRSWSLFALARFWLTVILEPPPALAQLLERTRRGDPRRLLPLVEASNSAFSQRCKTLSSEFFQSLYIRFMREVLPAAPRSYCRHMAHLERQFSSVVVVDGSRLDKIAHRLKILRKEKAAVLPGCLLGVYDLFRGVARQLRFDPDAAASEFTRAIEAMECFETDTLAVGDRLYGVPKTFATLKANGCFGLFRRNGSVSIEQVRQLSRCRLGDAIVEDWLVKAGSGKDAIDLRMIVLIRGRKRHEALTNVLDPQKLSAQDAAALYPLRWKVERLFYDLKVVLNLKSFYCANPNGVAMQVYAAAMVHAAFRIAQADIAHKQGLAPEELSPEKLFPLLSLASIKLIESQCVFDETCKVNPGVKLREPNWHRLPDTVVSLRHLRVQHRSPKRTSPRFHKDRAKWKSFTKIPGARKLT